MASIKKVADVYYELNALDFKSSKEKINAAKELCKKHGILFSDLATYSDAVDDLHDLPPSLTPH